MSNEAAVPLGRPMLYSGIESGWKIHVMAASSVDSRGRIGTDDSAGWVVFAIGDGGTVPPPGAEKRRVATKGEAEAERKRLEEELGVAGSS